MYFHLRDESVEVNAVVEFATLLAVTRSGTVVGVNEIFIR